MVFFATPWIPEVSWQPHGLQEETSGIYVVRLIDYGDLYRLYKKLVWWCYFFNNGFFNND